MVVAVMQLAIARANLGSFADLSALAGSRAQGDPCLAAANIATQNGVQLDSCLVAEESFLVTVSAPVNLLGPFFQLISESSVQVSARASRSIW